MSGRSVRMLCKYGGEALKPRLVNEKWISPAVSKRNAAKLRKRSIIDGTFGSFDQKSGTGWYVNIQYTQNMNYLNQT